MKTIMMGIFSVIIFFAVLFAVVGYAGYRALKNFPAYAEKSVVYSKYEDLVTELDKAVSESNSKTELAAKLENISYPKETIYLALESESNGSFVLLDQLDGEEPDLLVNKPHVGYGKVGDSEFVVINYAAAKYDGVKCVVYLNHNDDES